MNDLPVAIAEAARALVEKLPLSLLRQLDELGGDAIKMRRLRRLVRVIEEAQRMAEAKGIMPEDMKVLADHIGLPWMDKASLRDDEDLRKAWANLFVAITTEDNEDLHGTCVRILGEMNPWDCKVLDHVVRSAVVRQADVDDGYIAVPVQEDDIIATLASERDNRSQTLISIENLIRLGCLVRNVPAPIKVGGLAYGTLREALAVSATGVNLYCAATGQEWWSFAPVRTLDEINKMVGPREVQSERD